MYHVNTSRVYYRILRMYRDNFSAVRNQKTTSCDRLPQKAGIGSCDMIIFI